jgi:hypothetical protein
MTNSKTNVLNADREHLHSTGRRMLVWLSEFVGKERV